MTITLSQVAKASGYSLPTVSQILNSKGRFPKQTRDLVLKKARELGYRPNALAQAIRHQRFDCVTLLMSTQNRPYYHTGIIDGVHDRLAQDNVSLEIARLPDEKLTDEGFVPRILQVLRSDGLLIEYNHRIPERMIELIENHHLPSVWMNSKQSANCVRVDDIQLARTATEHLLGLGHQRIAYLSFAPSSHYSRPEREQGYCNAMADAGLSAVVRAAGQRVASPEDREAAYRSVLEDAARPTAVVTYSANEACGLIYRAALKGVRIPEDLSVIAFEDSVRGKVTMDIALTMVTVPLLEMARAATDMMLRRIADPLPSLPVERIPGELNIQATTAPPGA